VKAFKQSLQGETFQWLACHCSPHFENSALSPFIDLILGIARIGRGDPPAAQLRKLEQALAERGQGPDAAPLLASLLSIPTPAALRLNLSPQRQKQRTHEALLALLEKIAAKEPLCLVVDDLQWADPSTLELLGSLIERGPTMSLFTILTSRLDFRPPWTAGSHFTPVTVTRLPRRRVEAMILHLTRGKALPAEVLDQLVTRTDGVPLFVEELTRSVLEAGLLEHDGAHDQLSQPLPAPAIPATLRESLTARLDRLGSAKGTAQLAAIFGRQLRYEALRSISPLDEETLRSEIGRLVELEIIYARGVPPGATYTFKHALVQDAAYESLLKNKRKQGHQRVAEVLERSPEIAESQPEVLAHHYAAAGLDAAAARYLLRAGQKAIERSANAESLGHLGKALSLVEALPEGAERRWLELTLRTVIGVPLMATKGYGAAEVEQTYARALALGEGAEQAEGPLAVLWGLWIFYHVRGKYLTAYGLAEQLVRLAEGSRDSNVHLCAHLALGTTSLFRGMLAPSRAHLERCVAVYTPAEHRAHAYLYGQDPGMFSRVMLSWVLWVLGYPDAALEAAEQGVRLAEEASHPNSLGFALGMIAALHQFRGEVGPAERRSAELVALATEQGLAHWTELGHMVHGWAQKEQGRRDEGLGEMREGRARWERIGARVVNTHWESVLALACAEAGEADESLRLVRDTHAFMAESGERWLEPEVVRIEGEIALATSRDEAAAAGHFVRAIDLASRAGARTLALRAALSLARLRRTQGRLVEAREALGPIYSSFTEGFETPDLEEAPSLLAG
jgi:predicted ATPase